MKNKRGLGWLVIGSLILGIAALAMIAYSIFVANNVTFPAIIENIVDLFRR